MADTDIRNSAINLVEQYKEHATGYHSKVVAAMILGSTLNEKGTSGSPFKVDVVSALPASTAVIGHAVLNASTAVVGSLGASTAVIGSLGASTALIGSLSASESHIGESGGALSKVSVELTRPGTTADYAANTVIGGSSSAATVMEFANLARVNGGAGYIVAAILATNKKSITPRIRVHLFNSSAATLAADQGLYKELYADCDKRLRYFELLALNTAADTTNSDMSRSFDANLRHPYVCTTGTRSVFAGLETLDAFTPSTGEKFTLTLITENY